MTTVADRDENDLFWNENLTNQHRSIFLIYLITSLQQNVLCEFVLGTFVKDVCSSQEGLSIADKGEGVLQMRTSELVPKNFRFLLKIIVCPLGQ